MKRFRFSLEPLLKIREYEEKLKKNEYLEIASKYSSLLNESKEAFESSSRSYGELKEDPSLERGLHALRKKAFFLEREALSLEEELEKRKKEYNEARLRKRVLEIKKEKEWKEYIKEIEKEEQKEVDDIVQGRWRRF